MTASLAVVPRLGESSQPDAAWIKKHVSIIEIAKALGQRIRRRRVKCLRPENHAHGDADPSLHLYERGNTFRCFVCELRGSNIDLVMGDRGIPFGDAVRWVAERFAVPSVKPGRPVGRRNGDSALPYRVGISGSEFEVLVRSGMFAQLSAEARSILVALAVWRNPDTDLTKLSYSGISRYSGVRSRTSVSKALTQLARLRAIELHRGLRVGVVRESNAYRVTLEDPKFLASCNELFQKVSAEILREREYRAELRKTRQAMTARQASKRIGAGDSSAVPCAPASKKDQDSTNEGLNLSPSGGLMSNKSVHTVDREISFSSYRSVEEQKQILRERGLL